MANAGGTAGASRQTSSGKSTTMVKDRYGLGDTFNTSEMGARSKQANDWFSSIIEAAGGGPGSIGYGPSVDGHKGTSSGTMEGDVSGGNHQAVANLDDQFSRMFQDRYAKAISGPTNTQGGTARAGYAAGGAMADAQRDIVGEATDAASRMLLSNAADTQTAIALSPRTTEGTSSTAKTYGEAQASAGTKSCCFIMMEHFGYELPAFVREARDANYTPARRRGYVEMSKWLVPAIRVSKFVRSVANIFIIHPLTKAGSVKYGGEHSLEGYAYYPIAYIWFAVWSMIGTLKGEK